MNDSTNSPYQPPSADLIDRNQNNQIFMFKRFTAWGVFGLGLITLGIYTIYWLCTRSNIVNTVSDNKIEPYWIAALAITTALSFVSGLFGQSETAVMIAALITIAYLVAYLAVAFKLRNRLRDMMSSDSNTSYELSSILTFLFSAIYLQYKINEYIDITGGQT
ncbi:MAG: putative benzoate:H+ symporter BenE [Arenicella sp.]|jgi:predicted benzoate:H+ symporter BenE